MTTDKLRSVFQFYLGWIHSQGIEPREYPEHPATLAHLGYMCDKAVNVLIPTGKIEKAMRWLGFIQGVLVTREFFTLDQVKQHSMPDEEKVDGQ